MKTKGLIAIIMIGVLFISACSGGFSQRGRDDGDENYLRGTQGVNLNYLQGHPPALVYDGDTFDLVLELYNRGTFPTIADYYFVGYDPRIFVFSDPSRGSVTLSDAKTQFNADGGYEVVESTVQVNLPENTDGYTTPVKAIICYEYETTADPEVCIDPEPYQNAQNDVCQATSVSLSGGQGAPVAVTKVEQQPQRGKTRFKIFVQNVGGGTILDASEVRNCQDPRFSIRNYDKIEVVSVQISNGEVLQCKPDNPIILTNGQGHFFCELNGITGATSYNSILNIKLRYGYKDTTSATVESRDNG